MRAQHARVHLRVDRRRLVRAASPPGARAPRATRSRACAELVSGAPAQAVARSRARLHEQVDAVEQRTAQAAAVARQLRFAAAAALPVARVAAGTRVGRREQHEAGGVDRRVARPHDRHASLLQRLAQRLQRRARELRELVEEQHAVVGAAPPRRPSRAAAPPIRPAAVIEWWGARNGRRVASAVRGARRAGCGCASPRSPRSRDSGGRIEASRRASIVLPVPGGPLSSMLCAPAAAITSASTA